MLKSKSLVTMVILFLSGISNAEHSSFQGSTSLTYLNSDGDIEGLDVEGDISVLSGTFFLKPVQYKNHPYAEAAFLEKSSSLFFQYTDTEFELPELSLSSSSDSVGAGFFLVEPRNDFVFAGEYIDDEELDTISLGLGQYLYDNNLALLTYQVDRYDIGEDTRSFGISYKQVTPITTKNTKNILSWNASLLKYEDDEFDTNDTAGSIDLDFYIDRATSLNLSLEVVSGDNDSKAYGVGAQHFFQPNLSASLNFYRTSPDDIDADLNAFILDGEIRF